MTRNSKVLIPFIVLLLSGGVFLIFSAGPVFVPVVFALLSAYLLNPPVTFLEKKGWNRSMAIAAVFALILAVAAASAAFLFAALRDEFLSVQVNLPDYADRLYTLIPPQVKAYLEIETPEKVYLRISRALEELRGVSFEVYRETFTLVKKAFASTLGFVLAILGYLITPIYLYYFLRDLPRMREGLRGLVPERYRERFAAGAGELHEVLSAFVRGQLLVCAILAVLYSVGLHFIGIDLAVVIGSLAGIAFIIPYLGTVLGILLSMAMAALKFHDFLHPLLCLGWFVIVQALEGGIITPRVVGEKVGLHPVVIILAIILGGQLAGILGMLLAVPLTAVLKVLSRYLLDYYRGTAYYQGG